MMLNVERNNVHLLTRQMEEDSCIYFLAMYAANTVQPITAVQTAYTVKKHIRFIIQVINHWAQLHL